MIDYKDSLGELISKEVDLDKEEIYKLIEVPPDINMGDYAFPCYILAKKFKKNPVLIAKELAENIKLNNFFTKAVNEGPYLNFYLNRNEFNKEVLTQIYEQASEYGKKDIGKGRNVIVEFSSPNIAKPFHIGHIRTTVIGNSIKNIYEFMGFNTIAINHLGDYGTQFGMLIYAYKKWGKKEDIEKSPIKELLKLYIRFNEEMEENSELQEEAREWFKKLEQGDEEAKKLWQWFKDVSLKEFNRVYDMLNIEFDFFTGESFYSDKMQRVVDELEEKNLLEESQGAEIVDLEKYDMPSPLIKKSDGSTLYITRDIAASMYRKDNYNFYKNIYVVGSQQNLHFSQWIKIVELLGYDWAKDCVHVPFGMVSLEEGTLSTRKGRVVFLEDVLKKAVDKTKEIIEERNPSLENKEEVAEKIGIGAVIFQELYNNRIKDYTFSWDKTLSFEGETGPYVQYTYARTCSILDKAEMNIDNKINYELLKDDVEFEIIKSLYEYSNTVEDAMEKYEPFYITRYIVDLAQKYNRFYNKCPILKEEKDLKKARLLITKSVNEVIKSGLNLLGIEATEKM